MTPERWRKIKELYHAALEHDPRERNVFLAGACLADDGLRSEIESLLAQESDGVLCDYSPQTPVYGKRYGFQVSAVEAEQLIGVHLMRRNRIAGTEVHCVLIQPR